MAFLLLHVAKSRDPFITTNRVINVIITIQSDNFFSHSWTTVPLKPLLVPIITAVSVSQRDRTTLSINGTRLYTLVGDKEIKNERVIWRPVKITDQVFLKRWHRWLKWYLWETTWSWICPSASVECEGKQQEKSVEGGWLPLWLVVGLVLLLIRKAGSQDMEWRWVRS